MNQLLVYTGLVISKDDNEARDEEGTLPDIRESEVCQHTPRQPLGAQRPIRRRLADLQLRDTGKPTSRPDHRQVLRGFKGNCALGSLRSQAELDRSRLR